MSRVGKQIIQIPSGVTVKNDDGKISVAGPKGTLEREFLSIISIDIDNDGIAFTPTKKNEFSKALWGTYASHVKNMIKGVTEGYEKKLVIEGVGYKAMVEGQILTLNLGFSHPIKVEIPEGIIVSVEKSLIIVRGLDKELVGQFTAGVRALKKPEPYKGKGIRYENEVLRRKQGKKAVT